MQRFLVIWWMDKAPYAAVFTNRIAAEAAANVRNALVVTINGRHPLAVHDWYRRTDAGEPMPAEWRDILGQVRAWGPRSESHPIKGAPSL
jgi:hypothetical protein